MTIKLRAEHLDVHYGDVRALKDVNITIGERRLTALIGPSGCGKSTLLRVFNRMNDLVAGCRVDGRVELDGRSLYGGRVDIEALRRQVGMVFQRPNPFPLSVYDNVTYGLALHALGTRAERRDIADHCLAAVGLRDDLRGRLDDSALTLSAEQAQRLCIARAIAVEPDVLLMDEPCSALDPISTGRIEDLMMELKRDYSIVIVTHNMQQAARVSDMTAFFTVELHDEGKFRTGAVVEYDETDKIFTNPNDKRTEDYVTGKFG